MKTDTITPETDAAIWQRVVEFQGKLSPSAARSLLNMQFSEADHTRMDELSSKARAGTLSPQEQAELDTFERLGCLLSIFHSKARQTLRKKTKRAS